MWIIADRVRDLRRERKLDQQALADRAQVSMQTISNLETGRLKDIKISTLSALAVALNVSLPALLSERDVGGSRGEPGTESSTSLTHCG